MGVCFIMVRMEINNDGGDGVTNTPYWDTDPLFFIKEFAKHLKCIDDHGVAGCGECPGREPCNKNFWDVMLGAVDDGFGGEPQ